VETWPYSYLLCDEVGLGKTIEAGLAIRSLLLSGLAKRVLIAPPASLTQQWQRELASKFLLSFHRALSGTTVRHEIIHPVEETVTSTGLFAPDRCIVSTGLVGTYSGSGGQYTDPRTHKLRGTERDEIKHRFMRGEIDVLICTDAAAEGLNLQTADLLINYDLPWNPMKVEQRIGRIDRIGQKYEQVFVLNLCYVDSAEQIVYERLLNRLVQAGSVVGAQQISMLPVTRDEFNDLAARTLTEETLEKRARERLAARARRNQNMEIPADQLYEIYMRLKEQFAAQRLPINLEGIWRRRFRSDPATL
jgi:ERCC4-related helicase